MNKQFIILLILVATASSLLVVKPAFSSVAKPSVPEFTVKFVYASYDVTTTNPYTGLDETERISNDAIEITVKNQPFDYPDYQLYYNVRIKPHFADNWTDARTSMLQSNSSYTIIAFPVVPTNNYRETGYDLQNTGNNVFRALPDGSQLDFQVKAFIGHYEGRWVPHMWGGYGDYVEDLVIEAESDWSETQTVTISALLSQLLYATLIVLLSVASLGLVIFLIKRKQSH